MFRAAQEGGGKVGGEWTEIHPLMSELVLLDLFHGSVPGLAHSGSVSMFWLMWRFTGGCREGKCGWEEREAVGKADPRLALRLGSGSRQRSRHGSRVRRVVIPRCPAGQVRTGCGNLRQGDRTPQLAALGGGGVLGLEPCLTVDAATTGEA